MKRLVATAVIVGVLSVSGCTGSSDDEPSPEPTATASAGGDATALSEDGGVQVWDLTEPPTDEGFGIRPPTPSVDVGPDEPGPVRFELDGGSVELELSDLTYYHPEGDVFAFLSRTAELPPDELTATFRDVVEQLGVDDATADQFESELEAAPTDEAGQVSISYPDEIRLGDWTLALSAAISPSVGTGRVTVSGGYKPLDE